MRKLIVIVTLTITILALGNYNTQAEESSKKPLDEVFNNSVVVPFDYHGKVFLNGEKTDISGDYKLYLRDDRVLVPVRLMGNLVEGIDENNNWVVAWDPQKPNDVVLTNYNLHKTIKLTVNSKIMYVNNQPITLDVPPQKIDGRVVLPLRSTSEALEKEISWFEGLVFISNESIDFTSPNTTEIVGKIKANLDDSRKELDYEKRVEPIAAYQDTIYYGRTNYDDNSFNQELYRKKPDQPEEKIELPGEKNFYNSQLINQELYFVTTINGQRELGVFSLQTNEYRKLCDLPQYDGWYKQIKYINNELYIIIHNGDNTMGSETLYKLENGSLIEIVGAKNFINYDVLDGYLYYVDFAPLFRDGDNLYRINLETSEKENLGEKGFAFNISRVINDESTGWTHGNSFYLKDGYIYTLGYNESDLKDESSVYKISLDGKTQRKITVPTKTFWLIDNQIYYIDLHTGNLVVTDLEGTIQEILVERNITNAQFFNGNFYYTADNNRNLYLFDTSNQFEKKLSDHSVDKFSVGTLGVYYQSNGYDLGLYKIDENGENIPLVKDSLYSSVFTDSGVVFTLRYQEGVYVKK